MSDLMLKLVAGLSDGNPAAALIGIVQRIKADIEKGAIDDSNAAEVVAFLQRFMTRGKLEIVIAPKTSEETWLDQLEYVVEKIEDSDIVVEQFKAAADNVLDAIFDQPTETEFGFAELKKEEKKQIHLLISQLRELIEGSKLNARKKNALFSRLSELELEVDKRSTRTDRFFGAFSELGFALGDFGEKAKPMFDRMREILQIVYDRRSKDEGVRLPPPSEMTFLEFKKQDSK